MMTQVVCQCACFVYVRAILLFHYLCQGSSDSSLVYICFVWLVRSRPDNLKGNRLSNHAQIFYGSCEILQSPKSICCEPCKIRLHKAIQHSISLFITLCNLQAIDEVRFGASVQEKSKSTDLYQTQIVWCTSTALQDKSTSVIYC